MLWLLTLCFIIIIGVAIALVDHLDYSREWWYALLFIPIVLCFWVLSLFAYNRVLDYQANKCAKWSIETGFATKYRNIGYGDWECYGFTNHNWLPIERIRGFED